MWWLVIVAALGYFVDIYDLLLFSIVRVDSLKSLGLSPAEVTSKGFLLINCQMAGLLLGGILWGIMGDRKGRLKVLFGSILLYSLANLANAFVDSVELYAVCRFLAGIGLAGELGAGVTLVCEALPQKQRGYGTGIIAGIGIFVAVMANFVADVFPWRTAFIVGGVLGLALLIMRFRVSESSLYQKTEQNLVKGRGDFLALFRSRALFTRYIRLILVGLPLWFVVGILISFSPEFTSELGLLDTPKAGYAVAYCYAFSAFGDLFGGIISQRLRNRKKVIASYILALGVLIIFHLFNPFKSLQAFYLSCGLLGFAAGFWALFVTVAAESFGTDLRATVATTAPNFVRGGVIPLTMIFRLLAVYMGLRGSSILLGTATVGLALWALSGLPETYALEMDYQTTEKSG